MKNKKLLGILSLIFSLLPFLCFVAPVIAIAGIVMGIRWLSKEKTPDATRGLIMSAAGFVLSGVTCFIYLIIFMNLLTARAVKDMDKHPEKFMNQSVTYEKPKSTFELPLITRTLKDENNRTLKIKIDLWYYPDTTLENELKTRTDEIEHIIKLLTPDIKARDLENVSEKINLTEMIKTHINMRLINGKIQNVVIMDFKVE